MGAQEIQLSLPFFVQGVQRCFLFRPGSKDIERDAIL